MSRSVRTVLDRAGLSYVRIQASGGLDEYSVQGLVEGKAPIDIFGIGTKAGVSADAPWSDMAYKLVCYDGRPTMKLSTDKVSLPGAKQVFRIQEMDGKLSHDVLGLQDEELPGAEPVLEQVMSNGIPSQPAPTLEDIRRRMREDVERLSIPSKALTGPSEYPVHLSPGLKKLSEQVRRELEGAP